MTIEYKKSIIYYTITGEGPTILLLHGFMESMAMWLPFLNQLSKKRKVICIDLPGHGQSGCIGHIHSMEGMADAVFAVLQNEDITQISCIGHSMGGYVALALAKKHPRLFHELCLMNSTFEADSDQRKALRRKANELAKTNYKTLATTSFTNLFATESRSKYKGEIQNALEVALKTPLRGYIASQEGMIRRENLFSVFKNLKAKKALIISWKDWVVDGSYLKSKCINTDISVVEFSEGHMSHIENKQELSYFFKRFIEI